MSVHNASDQITATVLTWEGVTAHPHRFGGTEYRLGKREIGHIHGDHMLDIPFPTRVRDQILESGRADPHHLLPESGWVSSYLQVPEDIDPAIDLLHDSYKLAIQQSARKGLRRSDR